VAAFHEVQFPPQIAYGVVGGPKFHTTILTLSSGYERRNIDWSQARGTWDCTQGVKTQEDLNALLAFFYARNGRAYGFRFKAWEDFQVPNDGVGAGWLGATDGSTTNFQIVKFYEDSAASYVRTILKPVAGTVQVWCNGEPTTDFSVDTTTGIVAVGGAIAATSGAPLWVACQFDVPVRFDNDEMKVTIEEFGEFNWGGITLVELLAAD
jgi:uncharacterized protein (TIGR02217 family)